MVTMERKYREILPQGHSVPPPPALPPLPRKNAGRGIACNVCRIKRVSCDGQHPCSRCVSRGTTSECIYRTRGAAAHDAHADMISQLISLPENEAIDTLRRLRATGDVSGILATANGAAHGIMRPSERAAASAMSGSTPSSFELELVVGHSALYPRLPPLSDSWLTELLERRVDLQFEAPWHISNAPFPAPHRDDADSGGTDSPAVAATADASFAMPHSPLREIGTAGSPSPLGPHQPKKYCDPLLNELNIAYWTTVDITNEYAASLISLFLEMQHPVLGFFDADLFLQDLVQCRPRFCSSFLVNSVLYDAAHMCTSLDKRALTLVRLFGAEANRAWNAEKHDLSLMTLAASLVFGQTCRLSGRDALALTLTRYSRAAAKSLGLVGMPESSQHAAHLMKQPPEWRRAISHTAWGSYCYFSLLFQYYRDETFRYPPSFPIPGDLSDGSTNEDGVVYMLPNYMAKTFPAMCRFWTIVQEAAILVQEADRSGIAVAQHIPLCVMEGIYRKLLAWTQELHNDMKLYDSSPTHVVIFYLMFHSVVLSMFRPFLKSPSLRSPLEPVHGSDGTPEAVSRASLGQLKRLLWLCYSQNRGRPFHNFVNIALTQVSYAILDEHRNPAWRSTLSLYIRMWTELNICYPIFTQIAQAFFSMAIHKGAISFPEARTIMQGIARAGWHHESEEVQLLYFVNFAAAVEDPDNARLTRVAEKFGELVMFDEWTTGLDSTLESGPDGPADLRSGTGGVQPDLNRGEHPRSR